MSETSGLLEVLIIGLGYFVYLVTIHSKIRDYLGKKLHVKIENGPRSSWTVKRKKGLNQLLVKDILAFVASLPNQYAFCSINHCSYHSFRFPNNNFHKHKTLIYRPVSPRDNFLTEYPD